MQKINETKMNTHGHKEESKNYFQIYGITNDYNEMGWIHSIYFYLHSFLRSTTELSEITRRGKWGATVAVHTGR